MFETHVKLILSFLQFLINWKIVDFVLKTLKGIGDCDDFAFDSLRTQFRNANQWYSIISWLGGFNPKEPGPEGGALGGGVGVIPSYEPGGLEGWSLLTSYFVFVLIFLHTFQMISRNKKNFLKKNICRNFFRKNNRHFFWAKLFFILLKSFETYFHLVVSKFGHNNLVIYGCDSEIAKLLFNRFKNIAYLFAPFEGGGDLLLHVVNWTSS